MNKNWSLALCVGLTASLGVAIDAQAQQAQNYEITQVADDPCRAANNPHRRIFLVTGEEGILADPVNAEFSAWLKPELEERFSEKIS